MIYSFTVTIGANYLTGMAIIMFLPTKLLVLLKIIFFINLKNSKIISKIHLFEVCDL
jgi:hypothetical protein